MDRNWGADAPTPNSNPRIPENKLTTLCFGTCKDQYSQTFIRRPPGLEVALLEPRESVRHWLLRRSNRWVWPSSRYASTQDRIEQFHKIKTTQTLTRHVLRKEWAHVLGVRPTNHVHVLAVQLPVMDLCRKVLPNQSLKNLHKSLHQRKQQHKTGGHDFRGRSSIACMHSLSLRSSLQRQLY